MPDLPKWVGDLVENTFSGKFRDVRITSIENLHPQLRKIRFEGDLSQVKFKVGQAFIMRINDNSHRNYTPCFWDSQSGIFEVICHLHGNGPGSRYLSNLYPGDELRIGLPRGFNLHRKEAARHFFFGDESTIGVFKSLKDVIETHNQQYTGILELDNPADPLEMLERTGLDLNIVGKSETYAEPAVQLLRSMDDKFFATWKDAAFYLLGNARSIQHFRKELKTLGIPSRNIVTQPYWSPGKIGL